jgi:hypothetical protein
LNDFLCVKNVTEIAILTPTPSFIPSNNLETKAAQQDLEWFTKKNISDQQIYTEMPDF